MPTFFCLAFGAIASARSVTLNEGHFFTNNSPPLVSFIAFITKSTDSFSVNQNLVMRGSVIGTIFSPLSIKDLKKGITEPLLPATFP